MTSKERFLTAMRGGVADRVPVAPDTSNYIPCKMTGLPFWDIYFFGAVPLWRAYLDVVDHYGFDAWIASCTGAPLEYGTSRVETECRTVYDKPRDAMVRRCVYHTPDGDLGTEDVCYRGDPPSPTIKPIKDLQADWVKCRWLRAMPTGIDTAAVEEIRAECARRQVAFGLCLGYPGFHAWMGTVQGGIEPLSYALVDAPAILDEWFELDMAIGTRVMELILSVRPDYVLLGGSGTITLASPGLAMRYAIPAIARWTALAKAAGVGTMLHSCGKSRALVDMLLEHTELDCVNPLEVPPMGDVYLAEVKRACDGRLALMGNLHTTDVVLRGTPAQVRAASVRAMRDAGEGGGFILSTGDQCPRDTPEENLFAMIETACELGVYDGGSGRLAKLQG